MKTERSYSHISLAILLILALASPWLATAGAQDKGKEPQPAKKKTDPAEKKAEPAKKPEKSKVIAIVGGDVYTVTHEVIRGGTVLVKDGKILRVGQDLPIPEGATVIDAKGTYVTPGFVAL